MKLKDFYVEETLCASKKFLSENKDLKEEKKYYWIDGDVVHPCPDGMYYDFERETFRFLKK